MTLIMNAANMEFLPHKQSRKKDEAGKKGKKNRDLIERLIKFKDFVCFFNKI